jgi:hypothetical protein
MQRVGTQQHRRAHVRHRQAGAGADLVVPERDPLQRFELVRRHDRVGHAAVERGHAVDLLAGLERIDDPLAAGTHARQHGLVVGHPHRRPARDGGDLGDGESVPPDGDHPVSVSCSDAGAGTLRSVTSTRARCPSPCPGRSAFTVTLPFRRCAGSPRRARSSRRARSRALPSACNVESVARAATGP